MYVKVSKKKQENISLRMLLPLITQDTNILWIYQSNMLKYTRDEISYSIINILNIFKVFTFNCFLHIY